MRFCYSEEGTNRGRRELCAKLELDGASERSILRASCALVPRDGYVEAGISERDVPIASIADPRPSRVFVTVSLRVRGLAARAPQS
jgi:hypothetical protein